MALTLGSPLTNAKVYVARAGVDCYSASEEFRFPTPHRVSDAGRPAPDTPVLSQTEELANKLKSSLHGTLSK